MLLYDSYAASTFPFQVCPICSVKVARDMLSHITLQHGHLFKISFMMENLGYIYIYIFSLINVLQKFRVVFMPTKLVTIYVFF